MPLGSLEIRATNYRSMIIRTHVVGVYSHPYMYVSIYKQYTWTGRRWYLGAILGVPEDGNHVNLEMHFVAMIK